MKSGLSITGQFTIRRCTIVCLILLSNIGVFSSQASNSGQESANETHSTITGKVVADDGQPTARARVSLTKIGASPGGNFSVLADDNGEFIFKGITPGAYSAGAYHPGYITTAIAYCLPGDNITIHTTRGGVITGRVTDADGNPVVLLSVSTQLVKDSQGRPLTNLGRGSEGWTDDRGIYRIYGLRSGYYLVRASGKSQNSAQINPYLSSPAIYYPSGGRVSAKEVSVLSGSEVAGIDISMRNDPGHLIAGTVIGSGSVSPANAFAYLAVAGSRAIEDSAGVRSETDNSAFVFTGVRDGEYEIIAIFSRENGRRALSRVQRVTVKGHDVTGLRLSPGPSGSLSGRVVMETETAPPAKCASGSPASFQGLSITARNDDKMQSGLELIFAASFQLFVNDSGSFSLDDMYPGNYRLEWVLPSNDLYVKSIARSADAVATGVKTAANPLLNEIAVRTGEKVQPVSITIGRGAASLSGSVRPEKTNNALPDLLRVFLVPMETESANDIWRYYETNVDDEGKFTVKNIMPGRYRIIARRAYKIDGEDGAVGRLAWNSNTRTALRKEAEEKGKEIELKPCAKSTDTIVTVREQ